jgi:methylthioribose-1-phosphate isomerase
MKVNGSHYRSIFEEDGKVRIIDQRHLPHKFIIEEINHTGQMVKAIKDMHLRGAPLIGVAAAYGVYLAAVEAAQGNFFFEVLDRSAANIMNARPTASNLVWAVRSQLNVLRRDLPPGENLNYLLENARALADSDVDTNRRIGEYGCGIIEEISRKNNGAPVNILTHCNAGWLATVDRGTATAPIYAARDKGIPLHIWVDETRPRNQGAKLTAWELMNEGIDHTLIADNTGGHLMQHGLVDMVIVGTDRTTRTGDVANKIGTYLKALAAKDNGIPFYVALPSSTIDWDISDGVKEIPIEQRGDDEMLYVDGLGTNGVEKVLIPLENTKAANYAFDVTPARLVTGLITERGISPANANGILALFPERQ